MDIATMTLGEVLAQLGEDVDRVCNAAEASARFLRAFDPDAADDIDNAVQRLRQLAAR